jgi:phospholipid-binding lipoprotein MlaA
MAEGQPPVPDEATTGNETSSPKDGEGFEDQDEELDYLEEDLLFLEEEEAEVIAIYDPIEPFNRAMFHVNDRLYFWALKPAAQGYNFLVPEKARIGVRRFFANVAFPVRFVNALLQFKFKAAGLEITRFTINTTIGLAGIMDPARDRWKLLRHEEDLGQTLGFYGAGPGLYINWPVFGPSSLRDTLGMVGDIFLDPTHYLFPHNRWGAVGVSAYRRVNETSLDIGDYEDIKRDALEPYIFIRNAYHQHRESKIKE